jgi:predicted HTH domain antitoxin
LVNNIPSVSKELVKSFKKKYDYVIRRWICHMKENIIKIKYTDDVLLSLKETKEEFEEEARYLLALKLYELGKISSGKAAKIAGLSRVAFLLRLGRYRVSPFQVGLEEILEEAISDQ